MVEVVPELHRVSVVPPLQRVAADLLRQLHCIWVYLLHGIPNDILRTLN
jgi:hypothetical protein